MGTVDRTGCPAGRHGTRQAKRYHGCRCPDAIRAAARYDKHAAAGRAHLSRDTQHRVDSTGARRRIRALYAIGYRERGLAGRLGYSNGRIPWMHLSQRRVYDTTAAAVRALYDELQGTAGPSRHMRERAASRGWWPPIAWDGVDMDDPAAAPNVEEPLPEGWVDPVLLERITSGAVTAPGLSAVERRGVVEYLTGRGWDAADIAERLGVSSRTVVRDRGVVSEGVAA